MRRDQEEQAGKRLRDHEIQNGQHVDAFIPSLAPGGTGINGYDVLFVPVHDYFIDAMDPIRAKLKTTTRPPPSQVERTTPRGGTPGAAPAITAADVPKASTTPRGREHDHDRRGCAQRAEPSSRRKARTSRSSRFAGAAVSNRWPDLQERSGFMRRGVSRLAWASSAAKRVGRAQLILVAPRQSSPAAARAARP